MRFERASPAVAASDLLVRSTELALVITAAIAAGDEGMLESLLEEREHVVAAAVAACRDALAGTPSSSVQEQLTCAVRSAVAGGRSAEEAAQSARDLIVAELAVLDARQAGSQEYQSDRAGGTFDVVL